MFMESYFQWTMLPMQCVQYAMCTDVNVEFDISISLRCQLPACVYIAVCFVLELKLNKYSAVCV